MQNADGAVSVELQRSGSPASPKVRRTSTLNAPHSARMYQRMTNVRCEGSESTYVPPARILGPRHRILGEEGWILEVAGVVRGFVRVGIAVLSVVDLFREKLLPNV
jgi:hypothetical protein